MVIIIYYFLTINNIFLFHIYLVFAHVDLSIHKDEERNYNNINTEKDIVIIEGGSDFNDNNGTSTAIVDEVDKEGIFLRN